jgi:hypothetical protein
MISSTLITRTEKKKSDWDGITHSLWNKYAPPWRPSKEEQKYYEKTIKVIKPGSCLLLGSTPEIRDILAKNNIETDIIDSSIHMIFEMERLMSCKSNTNERYMVQDWQKAGLKKRYDLIIGDLILRNIPYGTQENFLQVIKGWLRGSLVLREHYINKRMIKMKPNDIINNTVNELKETGKKETQSIIISRLFDNSTDLSNHAVDRQKVMANLKQFIETSKDRQKNRFIYPLLSMWEGSLVWTQREKKENISLISRNFRKVSSWIASDYPESRFYPIYILSS